MGDLPLHQQSALEAGKAADPVLDKFAPTDSPSLLADSREQTTTMDQAMNPEVRLPERPRDVHQAHPTAKDIVSRTLKGKEKEWAAVAEKKRPLQLLDLPVDILREIVGHLPHTNDLTSLALCHSILHSLTIPCIYSRFDIVWPERSENEPTRAGVDALTYGLSTLVMAEELFGEAPWQSKRPKFLDEPIPGSEALTSACDGHTNFYPIQRRRRGNNYANYTKKFSLGNGPPDWVQEYSITKEGGKMLGTLVAVAVARMRNLEAFIWDMPTGVLRDIWLALSSLADRDDGQDCRLEKVWIRWHNNTEMAFPNGVPPPPPQINPVPPPPPISVHPPAASISIPNPAPMMPIMDLIEYPTFSVLPPLKSLSVLDIDELAYLDEMSILIARSQRKLKELRVGVAPHAHNPGRVWVSVSDGENFQQVDYNSTWPIINTISEKRLGGVLGVLVGRIYNMRNNSDTQRHPNVSRRRERLSMLDAATAISAAEGLPDAQSGPPSIEPLDPNLPIDLPALAPESDATFSDPVVAQEPQTAESSSQSASSAENDGLTREDDVPTTPVANTKHIPLRPAKSLPPDNRKHGPYLSGKLQLETLELERVPLSVEVLQHAFDWSVLTNLTLLHCQDHELLWKILRRNFSPTSPYNARQSQSSKSPGKVKLDYSLNLKKVHTDTVTQSLISFLKETLAPNSLEVLFLQEARNSAPTVTIDHIYKGPIRRHRSSLKKLLIDSSGGVGDDAPVTRQWEHWMLTHEIVTYITSGKMNSLRELGVTLDYQDWHYLLQRLPMISHVRSLYIPHIAHHPHGANLKEEELAMQIVDIVTLRPEVELCYMGLARKCYEIIENKYLGHDNRVYAHGAADGSAGGGGGGGDGSNGPAGWSALEQDWTDEEDSGEGDADDVDAGSDDLGDVDDSPDDPDDVEDDDDSDDSSSTFGAAAAARRAPKLKLREILFYDDKVSIFKARHGHL